MNIAVIGVGYWGPNLVRTFLEIPEVKKVFVYDKDPEKLTLIKRKHPNVEVAAGFDKILSDPDILAAAIATPVTAHFELAREVLSHGKHVFVEKPLATNSKDCEILAQLAREKNKVLMVGHILEYKPAMQKIRDLITNGEIGEVLYADASRLNLGKIQGDVSVLWDAAVHDIYVLNFILNKPPKRVSAVGASYPNYTRTKLESVAFLTLDYGQNLLAHIHINWLSPLKIRRMMICGTKKMLVYDDVDLIEPLKIYDKGVELNSGSPWHAFPDYRIGDTLIPQISSKEPLKIECQHFVECVLNNLKPQSDAEKGRNTVRILEAAEESLKNQSKFINIDYGTV